MAQNKVHDTQIGLAHRSHEHYSLEATYKHCRRQVTAHRKLSSQRQGSHRRTPDVSSAEGCSCGVRTPGSWALAFAAARDQVDRLRHHYKQLLVYNKRNPHYM